MLTHLKQLATTALLLGGRVDPNEGTHVFYQSQSPFDGAAVRRAWERRLARIGAEGRLFVIPTPTPGYVHDRTVIDYVVRAQQLGITPRRHLLRIKHNHRLHDLQFDAAALEFETEDDRLDFQAMRGAMKATPPGLRAA